MSETQGTLFRPEQEKTSEIPAFLRGCYSMELEPQVYFVTGLSQFYGMPLIIFHSLVMESEVEEDGAVFLAINDEA